MAKVHAITPILHGNADGTVTRIEIGEEITSLSEDEVRSLVLGGSAVEIGKGRKYSPETATGPTDEATVQRDALIAQSLAGDDPSPAAAAASGQGTVSADDAKAKRG